MKVAFFSTCQYDKAHFQKFVTTHELVFFKSQLVEQTVNLANGYDAVCVCVNDELNHTVIKALKKCGVRLIALRCAGFSNVDIHEAAKYGISVVRVPAYSPQAVAEHAAALILTLNRKTHKAYNRIKEGDYSLDRLNGFNLFGKTVGVIGTGKIGQVFCGIMQGFGCKVIAFDLVANQQLMAVGVDYRPLIDLFQQADIISLHCPLTEQTKHLINQQTIAMMKDGVMLVNTCRGGLIDTGALVDGLSTGKIGMLCLDRYEQEETFFFDDLSKGIGNDDAIMLLNSFPNVLITAQQGFFTEEALSQIASITLSNIDDFDAGLPLKNKVV